MERYYNLYRGFLPLSTFMRFVTAVSAILSLVSYVALPRCGVETTLGNARSGFEFVTGSFSKISMDMKQIGGSALTDDIKVPERDMENIEKEIPVTYVPARNTIFLALAAAYGETIEASSIFIGANAIDYSGYPDCRPEFFNSMEDNYGKVL